MNEYTKECIDVFLSRQDQLFDEPVARTEQEAREFLDECMAVVVDSEADVVAYFEEEGADIAGMSEEEICSAQEVFALPSGKYLIVEG